MVPKCFQVEELALQSMISAREENVTVSSTAVLEEHQNSFLLFILGQMDNEATINQTKLQLHVGEEDEEEEEEEESDS
ncbi:snRNA-activating protein complex subunit 5 [Sphaerodactylus townsendi]|uniref:snRNA-activating protein complex subunit 5 n=1 Tax=Sphaerodactylus townsendi TaxID=933632 RepID=UPI00202704C8|nr:snRNA-activating protein complex subunit 5 [Sphaerodactylus townsendi]